MNRRDFLSCNMAHHSQHHFGTYPKIVLRTQENQPVRFYEDLIRDKIAVINFMYAHCQGVCPVATANLVKVQRMLKNRIGRDIFMYSITLKPEHDTPAVLKEYAHLHGVKPGWLFLTGSEYDITTLRFLLLRQDHAAADFNLDQHTGMVRILNDAYLRSTMCPAAARPFQIVDAISWVEPTKPFAVRFRENIQAQARRKQAAREAIMARAAQHL